MLVAQGNLTEALAAFKASLAIRERLAKADPGNAGWQLDIAASLQRVGDMAQKNGDTGGALGAFRRGLEIMSRLTSLAPDHAGFRHALGVLERRIAALEGDTPEGKAGDTAPKRGWLSRLFGG